MALLDDMASCLCYFDPSGAVDNGTELTNLANLKSSTGTGYDFSNLSGTGAGRLMPGGTDGVTGKPTLLWDPAGTSYVRMNLPANLAQPCSYVMVNESLTSRQATTLIGNRTWSTRHLLRFASDGLDMRCDMGAGSSSLLFIDECDEMATDVTIMVVTVNGASTVGYLYARDGSLITSGTISADCGDHVTNGYALGWSTGATLPPAGAFMGFSVFDKILTTQEITDVVGYYSNEWTAPTGGAPDKGPFNIKQSPDSRFYAKHPDGDKPYLAIWNHMRDEFDLPPRGRPGNDVGHPLPWVASWNFGINAHYPQETYFTPRVQTELTDSGAYFVPRMGGPTPYTEQLYWGEYLDRLEQYDAPLFLGTNEVVAYFGRSSEVQAIPKAQNPLVYQQSDGQMLLSSGEGWLDILAPDLDIVAEHGARYIQQAGAHTGAPVDYEDNWKVLTDKLAHRLSKVYWIDNNESGHFRYSDRLESERWNTAYPSDFPDRNTGNTAFYKVGRETVHDVAYRAAKDQLKEYFPKAQDPKHMVYNWGKTWVYRQAIWSWTGDSEVDRLEYSYNFPECDAISPDNTYFNNWEPWCTDSTVGSVQLMASQAKFAIDEWKAGHPDYYLEVSTWMQDHINNTSDPIFSRYTDEDQWNGDIGEMSYERYGASQMYIAWILRPRILREFIPSEFGTDQVMPALEPLLKYVKPIHDVPEITRFWRNGEIVENTNRVHPWNENTATNPHWLSAPRWYLLDTEFDDSIHWEYANGHPNFPVMWAGTIPVFAIAMKLGSDPDQEWLVYITNPMNDKGTATVTVPGFRDITVPVSDKGRYYLCKQNGGSVTEIVWQ